ncbi:MAG TPA: glycoside hydrolase family 32 protein, partial [Candidatus Limnocylindrales bacterium]|nr:glycoside hydrolase family 32 protein [Candidatus Limnocylindrales bacterium]
MSLGDRDGARGGSAVRDPAADPLRPTFHLAPPRGWINDPNGLIQVDGTYHVFYQYNPAEAVWGNIHWGHASSPDLVRWQQEPVALAPSPDGPDADGCWSGSAVMGASGPVIFYTGRRGDDESVCVAHGDRQLRTWTKDADNPILEPPPELELSDFRDPKVWSEGSAWRMLVGAGSHAGSGLVLSFRSDDLKGWELVGPVIEGEAGGHGEVWECPDLFHVDGRDVLIYSVTPGQGSTRYVSGAWDGSRLHASRRGLIDLGSYLYAAQTLRLATGRHIIWGWIREGRSVRSQRAAGWSGMLSIPRAVSMDSDGRFLMAPLPELEALRLPGGVAATDLRLVEGVELLLSEDAGPAWELRVGFVADAGARLRLTLCASSNGAELTTIEIDPAEGRVQVDRRRSSLTADVDRDVLVAELWDAPDTGVDLRIFVDGTVIEAFIDGISLTTRVYPTRVDSTRIALVALAGDV